MAGYIGSKASVVSSGAEHKKVFDITTTTTSLTGLVYTPTLVHVFHNGVRLVDGTDYTATSGTTITLTVAAENGDQVVVISYATFQTSDTVSASAGGTFGNNVSVTGTLAATAVTGDGSGLTSLTSANLTGALPAISGAALTSLPAGSVLQVVQGTYLSSMSTTSTSYVDTGITATITPLFSTSSIMVIVNLNGGATSAVGYKLLRGSTELAVPSSGSGLNATFASFLSSSYLVSSSGFNYVDSPATISATTYKIQIVADTGTVSINRRVIDTVFGFTSNIILMEIAA
jgi:hypothetical protein